MLHNIILIFQLEIHLILIVKFEFKYNNRTKL